MRLLSTRNPDARSTFRDAAAGAQPPDGGLWVPAAWPRLHDLDALLALPWAARNVEVLARLLGEEFTRAELATLAGEALDFPIPLVLVEPGVYALELFHGPTLAFKDVGARVLAGVLARSTAGPRTILTATSGDTGAAVAHAFWRRPGFRAVVLYPAGRVSPRQERQFACLGENVHALAVEGSFDDCQALAKACFADAALNAELGLTSANSINIARLLAQSLYYLEAVAQLRARGVQDPPVIAVPSGNFGNLCAGLMAQALGLEVKAFVAATNANDTVPAFLDGGPYAPRPSVPTLSNAMDVGAPSNWERIAHAAGDPARLRDSLRWDRCSNDETLEAMRALAGLGYAACPHTAVAWAVLKRRLRSGETGVFLATAHAAKFPEVVAKATGRVPAPPEALAALEPMPVLARPQANDVDALKAALRSLCRD
ncbi:MAG: threonine synthase [Holophagaceae bacterium]